VTVALLVMTFNQEDLTTKALNSLRHCGWPVPVLLLDNGSGADAKLIRDDFQTEVDHDALRVYDSATNLGVAGGRNHLADLCTSDWLVFCDNDVAFTPELATFVAELHVSRADVMLPVILSTDAKHVWSAGGTYVRWVSWSRNGFHGRLRTTLPADTTASASWGAGACLAVRREVFWSLSGFDTGFAEYGAEDLDFCLRAREAGHVLRRSNSAPIVHFDVRSALPAPTRSRALRSAAARIRQRHGIRASAPLAAAFSWLRAARTNALERR
jgi:GT2 family glycosyltransferase